MPLMLLVAVKPVLPPGGHRLHGDAGDGQAAGDDAADGVRGFIGQQLGFIALAAGVEQTLGAPDTAIGGELELGGAGGVLHSGHTVVRERQIAAGGAVLEIVGAVAGEGPQLLVAGSGGGQRDLAAVIAEALIAHRQGVVAAGEVRQLHGGGGGDLGKTRQVGGHAAVRSAAGRQAVGTVGQRGVGVGVEHYQRVRRLVDVQAAVHAELHVAGVGAEISHGLAGYAVFAGGVAGHALGLGGLVQTAALGVDGLDQLGLALVLEAAQRVEGTEDDAGGAAAPIAAAGAADHTCAVVDAAAPEHIAQSHGVVIQIEGGDGGLDVLQQVRIGVGLPIVLLGLHELVGVVVSHAAPGGVEIAAVAGGVLAVAVVGVGVIQRVAHVAVDGAGLELLQPLDEAQGRAGVAGEHIDAVGRAAAVAADGGDVAWVGAVARLVVLAQVAQSRVLPVLAGGQQRRGQQAQHHGGGQHHGGAPLHPFHRIHPAFSVVVKAAENAADLHNH